MVFDNHESQLYSLKFMLSSLYSIFIDFQVYNWNHKVWWLRAAMYDNLECFFGVSSKNHQVAQSFATHDTSVLTRLE